MKPVFPMPLLETAQTAAIIRERHLNGPVVAMSGPCKKAWDALERKDQQTLIYRSSMRSVLEKWYAWHLTKPRISDRDMRKGHEDVKDHRGMWFNERAINASLRARGYDALLTTMDELRGRLFGSGVVFFREHFENAPQPYTDDNVCAFYMNRAMGGKTGMFLLAGVDPCDLFPIMLSKVFLQIEETADRRPTYPEFGIISKAIVDFMMRPSRSQKAEAINDMMYQAAYDASFNLTWNDGQVAAVELKRPDNTDWANNSIAKSFLVGPEEKAPYTGCPAIFARVANVKPANPVKAILDMYVTAAAKSLFCPASAPAHRTKDDFAVPAGLAL